MTKQEAKEWLPVVVHLREYYEGKNDDYLDMCPLCAFVDEHGTGSCPACLWRLFEGNDCPPFTASDGRHYRSSWWVEEAIPRCKRWEKELKKVIKKGVKK